MELRKVQLTGGSSLTVTLPKAWVDRVELKPGDFVGCTELPDGSLAVHPHARSERALQRHVIEVEEGAAGHLFRKIIAAYLMGHDVIVVSSKRGLSADARAAVRKAVGRIIGLEVVEEEPNRMTLQDFLDPREFHTDKALRRMAMLANAMQQEALTQLSKPTEETLRSVNDRDDEVDRLYWLVNKQYHAMLRDASYASRMNLTAGQALNYLLVARLVERTADHAARIAQQATLLQHGKAQDALLARLDKHAARAVDMFRAAMETFHKRDAAKADALIDEAKRFQDAQERLLKDATALGGEPVSHLALILESVGRTAAYAADVAEVAINHEVASPA